MDFAAGGPPEAQVKQSGVAGGFGLNFNLSRVGGFPSQADESSKDDAEEDHDQRGAGSPGSEEDEEVAQLV